ncbi:hypothetical protein AKJ09_01992 [Labilithrix luteola]|uniref:Outer membrane lipoprotein BamD-like domain-containing protein n=1 Tax=Labilithrix luteola TaxID=1391654 RepID=A0A0K1PP80_9BACT|nr:hypothetical protein [Labilithrix luteola]AKU95328.1 hypothetical protein AKJ09_01992 [Labilithrix luteola]
MEHLDPASPALTSDQARLKETIVDSARDDVPPPGARDQVLSALKLVSAAGSSPAASARRVPMGRSASILGLVVAVGAASIGGGVAMSRAKSSASSSAPAESPAPVAAHVESTATVDPEPTVAVSALPSSPDEVRDTAPTANEQLARRTSKPTAPQASHESDESTLGRELARVTAARNALTGGDAASALRSLDAYDAEFPRGTFSVEVSVLRIEALARTGRSDEARELGNRFLARYPQGVLARRVATTLRTVTPQASAPAPSAP